MPVSSMEELVDRVDAIMVIAADNAAWHEQVAELPLKSGKPVFVDKTFAPTLAAGKCMFALAEQYHTPVFSSSAQRYCQDLLDYGDGRLASFMQTPQPYAEFNFMVSDGETGKRLISDDRSFYHNLMKAILDFFVHGTCPVPHEETLEILAIIDAARQARIQPDTWLPILY